jgi:nicotinamidase-related amidase
MLYNKQVPIEQSALLVIDVQDSFKVLPRWSRRNNPEFEKNVSRLVDAYRAAGLPVIFVLHSDEDPGWEKSSPHYKVMSFLSPCADEPILEKITRNAFTSTNLAELLLEKGVRRVVITGIQTEQCCETSARVAADLGYAVDFVSEATMTFPIAHPDDATKELGTDAIVERTEYALRGRFARIRTVADLEQELKGARSLAHAG